MHLTLTRSINDRHLGPLLMLPAALTLLATVALPIVLLFASSFQHGALGLKAGKWVGLDNYQTVLTSDAFPNAVAVSIIVTTASVGLILAGALALATVLNGAMHGRAIARSLVVLPWALPTFVAAFAWRWILDYTFGPISHLLIAFNVQPPVFLADKTLALVSGIVVYAWKDLPWATVVLLAALQTISQDLRDAARVDGAGGWQEFRHIVAPGISFAIQIVVILLFVWCFNWFEMMWLLTGGGPGSATTTIPILIYKTAFGGFQFDQAAAIGVMVLPLVLVVTLVFFRLWSRQDSSL
jgi:ABC-type sugar transport system permease subunit